MEQVSVALEPVRVFMVEVGQFLPKLLIAAVILVAGWLLAKLARLALDKGLKIINFNVLAERAGMDDFLKQGDIKTDTVGILALLAYWLVILLALMMAFNSLGLTYVTDLVGRVVLFVPKVVVAVLILAIGAYFARFVSRVVGRRGRRPAGSHRHVCHHGICGADCARSDEYRWRYHSPDVSHCADGRGAGAGLGIRHRRPEMGRSDCGSVVAKEGRLTSGV